MVLNLRGFAFMVSVVPTLVWYLCFWTNVRCEAMARRYRYLNITWSAGLSPGEEGVFSRWFGTLLSWVPNSVAGRWEGPPTLYLCPPACYHAHACLPACLYHTASLFPALCSTLSPTLHAACHCCYTFSLMPLHLPRCR